ncbi:2-polyprenyl-6-methoxyphenol hydroxylase-like FAD-dependent oxidoreductase [Rhizobium sp. ERR 922]|uniref:FAD-dependent oxidoreductase n=1 Tax=unclassified Rhizobium TaxID=2613769 RepID=UPI0011A29BCF|nr:MULTISPECIES: NAD(P)/FAD-dependent oxidoreductase [unclassified Rhizobium]TWB61544.1 2-polyprenyl-6-methoxyphenol hydroxylase-like FAD-dependent oxidoreductase [Rhizobium sp. ERR 922]TWC04470.1 2-polyprenyl-6-methoxyphenol hydroxylase-like FAD-dependent oxidoreductase [Rhizobium sp. ERR 942]
MGEGTGGQGKSKSILIAGAGPVGLAAALELARRGFSPRIVDDSTGPTPLQESRALGVNARTLTLLSPSGVAERIIAAAQPIEQFRVRSNRKILIRLDTREVKGRFSAVCALPQGSTERELMEALSAYGISPEWQTAVVAEAIADFQKPEVTLRRADGTSETVRPDILIGADGAHSAVRKALGAGFPGEALEAYFYLADFRYAEPVDTHFAEISLFDPGMVGRLPVTTDIIRYISTLEDFESRIAHPAAIAEKTWASQFRIHFRHVEPMAKGNVFLAGDAAHIHSPAGARGMNLGIEDACWLAWLIAEGREQEYSALRVPAVKQVLKQTYGLTRLVTMQSPLAVAARNFLAPLLLRFGPVRRQLLRGVAGYDTPKPPWIDWAE